MIDAALLDLYEAAFLAGGVDRVVDTAVVALLESGRVRAQRSGELTVVNPTRRSEVEAAVLDAIGTRDGAPSGWSGSAPHRTSGWYGSPTGSFGRACWRAGSRAGSGCAARRSSPPPLAGVSCGSSAPSRRPGSRRRDRALPRSPSMAPAGWRTGRCTPPCSSSLARGARRGGTGCTTTAAAPRPTRPRRTPPAPGTGPAPVAAVVVAAVADRRGGRLGRPAAFARTVRPDRRVGPGGRVRTVGRGSAAGPGGWPRSERRPT